MTEKLLTRLSHAVHRHAHKDVQIFEATHHGIDVRQVSKAARKVVKTLHEGGYDAYIVGGGVRDLMLGLQPKDFDVATDARPEQVRELFDRCRIIGRRFRLVHVWVDRDRIEVATFRGGEHTRAGREQLAVTVSGRILRDNAYGTIEHDAERRDFTVNSLFYDPTRDVLLDFVGGMEDLEQRQLRMIGKPVVRFREDPVRLLRAVRLAAKLDFAMDPEMEHLIPEMTTLLESVSPSRMFMEVAKLLHNGAAWRTFQSLCEKNLLEPLFPRTAQVLEQQHPEDLQFIEAALKNTDERVHRDLPVSPAFAYAVMLWPHVRALSNELSMNDFSPREALEICGERALQYQARAISIPFRHAQAIRQIWMRQPQLEKGPHHHPERVMAHAGFRAAYDFLGLRAQATPALEKAHREWTKIQEERAPTRGRRRHHHRRK